jgi:ribonuclease E
MTKRMLVDATHPEEVRVAIIQDNRLSDLEIEITAKKQIKGNIYLGKVSRVEQSLQAAFIDFGQGRQGFLPLNDIHEKYFPKAEAKTGGVKKGRGRGRKPAQAKTPETPKPEQANTPEPQKPEQANTPEPPKPAQANTPEPQKPEQANTPEPPKPAQANTPEPQKPEQADTAEPPKPAQAQAKAPEPQISLKVSELQDSVPEPEEQKTAAAPEVQTQEAVSVSATVNLSSTAAEDDAIQFCETPEEKEKILAPDSNTAAIVETQPAISEPFRDENIATTPATVVETTAAENTAPVESGDSQPTPKAQTPQPEAKKPVPARRHQSKKAEEKKPTSDRTRRPSRRRPPPIQQILSRGQTVLVQVVKEARGNKGASLTTNISLAGRYSVLLPENSGGGGISRKINDGAARKNLKEILNNLEIPEQISLIIRTAGLDRTKREILRDMNYMLRVWKVIQEKMETAEAPCPIHEESDLITRTIRDLYTTDMEEILIEGQQCYRRGKDFMRLLMPGYVKVVQPYKDSIPLFSRYQVENQIETMHNRVVQLKSGGYLVIDSTEALISIDINSGRATKEKDIETTAYKTNLLAADEIARQLRLRDLGGLVVIDFIDMDDKKHNTDVEKRVKDAFKNDRARIQIGRISQFGLLELSRQRMKPAFSEASRQDCPRCKGLGTIRAVESSAIYLFRCIEEEISKGAVDSLIYYAPQEVANYIFNNKRSQLVSLEQGNNVTISIHGDPELQTPEFRREKPEQNKKNPQQKKTEPKKTTPPVQNPPEEKVENRENQAAPTTVPSDPTKEGEEAPVRKKRRRRRRKRNPNQEQNANNQQNANSQNQPGADSQSTPAEAKQPAAQSSSTTPAPEGVQETSEPAAKEAIPTTVPGIYVLPEAGTTAVKTESKPQSTQQSSPENSEGKEPDTTTKKPRRRRRRRSPTQSQQANQAQSAGQTGNSEAGSTQGNTPDGTGNSATPQTNTQTATPTEQTPNRSDQQ